MSSTPEIIKEIGPYVAGAIGAAGTWYLGVIQQRSQSKKDERSTAGKLYEMELELMERSRKAAQEVVDAQLNEMKAERKALQERVVALQERVAILESHQRELERAKWEEELRLKGVIEELENTINRLEGNVEYYKGVNGQLNAEIVSLRLDLSAYCATSPDSNKPNICSDL